MNSRSNSPPSGLSLSEASKFLWNTITRQCDGGSFNKQAFRHQLFLEKRVVDAAFLGNAGTEVMTRDSFNYVRTVQAVEDGTKVLFTGSEPKWKMLSELVNTYDEAADRVCSVKESIVFLDDLVEWAQEEVRSVIKMGQLFLYRAPDNSQSLAVVMRARDCVMDCLLFNGEMNDDKTSFRFSENDPMERIMLIGSTGMLPLTRHFIIDADKIRQCVVSHKKNEKLNGPKVNWELIKLCRMPECLCPVPVVIGNREFDRGANIEFLNVQRDEFSHDKYEPAASPHFLSATVESQDGNIICVKIVDGVKEITENVHLSEGLLYPVGTAERLGVEIVGRKGGMETKDTIEVGGPEKIIKLFRGYAELMMDEDGSPYIRPILIRNIHDGILAEFVYLDSMSTESLLIPMSNPRLFPAGFSKKTNIPVTFNGMNRMDGQLVKEVFDEIRREQVANVRRREEVETGEEEEGSTVREDEYGEEEGGIDEGASDYSNHIQLDGFYPIPNEGSLDAASENMKNLVEEMDEMHTSLRDEEEEEEEDVEETREEEEGAAEAAVAAVAAREEGETDETQLPPEMEDGETGREWMEREDEEMIDMEKEKEKETAMHRRISREVDDSTNEEMEEEEMNEVNEETCMADGEIKGWSTMQKEANDKREKRKSYTSGDEDGMIMKMEKEGEDEEMEEDREEEEEGDEMEEMEEEAGEMVEEQEKEGEEEMQEEEESVPSQPVDEVACAADAAVASSTPSQSTTPSSAAIPLPAVPHESLPMRSPATPTRTRTPPTFMQRIITEPTSPTHAAGCAAVTVSIPPLAPTAAAPLAAAAALPPVEEVVPATLPTEMDGSKNGPLEKSGVVSLRVEKETEVENGEKEGDEEMGQMISGTIPSVSTLDSGRINGQSMTNGGERAENGSKKMEVDQIDEVPPKRPRMDSISDENEEKKQEKSMKRGGRGIPLDPSFDSRSLPPEVIRAMAVKEGVGQRGGIRRLPPITLRSSSSASVEEEHLISGAEEKKRIQMEQTLSRLGLMTSEKLADFDILTEDVMAHFRNPQEWNAIELQQFIEVMDIKQPLKDHIRDQDFDGMKLFSLKFEEILEEFPPLETDDFNEKIFFYGLVDKVCTIIKMPGMVFSD